MKSELYHRLKQVDPNLKIVSGRRLPYVLSPRDVEAMGLPPVKGRRPPEAILNLEGMYSKDELITMAREHRLSDEGGKYELVVRLVRAGILQLENDIEEPVSSSPSTIPKGKPEKMPRIDPHASALKQDQQLRRQMKWLKQHGFKTAREAQEAGY